MRQFTLLPLALLLPPLAAAIPTATTTACPLLNGLRCSNPPETPVGGVAPCSLDGNAADATACRRRLLDPGADCPGSTYVSQDGNGQWHCGAGACTEWVQAPEWTTQAVDPDPCPSIPVSDAPITIAAATSVSSQSQGRLLSFIAVVSRPAGGRRRHCRKLEEQAQRRALWGSTKSKVPVNYALRLDLPGRLNATVKHVSIFPTIKPWADKTPQVVGESLLWPRVPMGEDTKRATKRKFKALVRVRSGVNNVGPMTFTAVVYRVEGNGVVTDLHQASATVTVTPGKSLLGGF